MRILTAVLLVSFAIPFSFASAREVGGSRFSVELELGPVVQSRNNVQIPNSESGTRFSLVDLVGRGPYPAGRIYVTWNISGKHELRALLAPLKYTEQGVFSYPVEFEGGSFDPEVGTDATYKFNSWRLTYRYLLFDKPRMNGWIGFTAKIRDAKIRLEQEGESSEKTDLGFVPLVHLCLDYQLSRRWGIILDIDALAGGPGRAEDLSLKLCYSMNERLRVTGGYRTLEGGADVEEVYNFAWLHYAVVSVLYGF